MLLCRVTISAANRAVPEKAAGKKSGATRCARATNGQAIIRVAQRTRRSCRFIALLHTPMTTGRLYVLGAAPTRSRWEALHSIASAASGDCCPPFRLWKGVTFLAWHLVGERYLDRDGHDGS
jgi:hypothetical protein